MRSRAPFALAAIALALGCGGPRPPGGPMEAAPAPAEDGRPAAPKRAFTLTDAAIDALVQQVSAARQVPPRRPVKITRLDPKPFVAHLLHGRQAKPAGAGLTEESAFLLGFNFVPEPGKRGGISSMSDVLAEQVVGFYDTGADEVFIPNIALKSADDLLEQQGVLAHEVHHALQAQQFPKAPKAASEDESLAQLALIEGDAMVAMGAWIGAEAGAPVGRTLRRIVEVTKKVPLASVTRGEESRKLDKALDLTKKQLEFPYRDGMLMVADVYRAGGFPLVDKLYASPPRSTEQVLHPEKYLAGELPRPVADPRAPAGYTRRTVDTLGELSTRILLERCLDAQTAERAAAGWAGDRFGVFVGPHKKLAVAWISAWDTDRDAEELESALGKSAGCWHDNALGAGGDDYTIGADVHVRRQGKFVSFLRGFPKGSEAAIDRDLFALPGPEPKAKPLTDLKIPPRAALPEPRPGAIEGDVYRNDWLGVVGRVPQGMLGRAGKSLDFVVERTDVLVRGGMMFSPRITSDAENEETFREAQEGFVAEIEKLQMQVQVVGNGPAQTALGAGTSRTWRVYGTMVELRLIMVPICAGTGSIVFVLAYGDPYAKSVLEGWVDSFRWINGRNIVACDYLDPK